MYRIVAQTCKVFGYSRDSLFRFKNLYETGDVQPLQELSRKKPNLRSRVDPAIEEAVCALGIDLPAYCKLRVSNELKEKLILTEVQLQTLEQVNEQKEACRVESEHPGYLGS